jgi:two-component system phosphate regulon sensor histidine kinase PhoR
VTAIGPDQQVRPNNPATHFLRQVSAGRLSLYGTAAIAAVAIIVLLWLTGGMATWAALVALVALAAIIAAVSQHREAPQEIAEPATAPNREAEQRQAERPAEIALPAKPDTSWRAVVSAMPDPALALDAGGIIVHHNAAVADLFQRVRVGQPLSSVSRSPELLAAIDKTHDAGDVTIVELQDRVPVQRRVSAILTPLSFKDPAAGEPALLVTFRDITDQEKLAQMRADFIAHASHELRTPLASLRGFVETLQGPARNDVAARERFLGIMAAQAARMTRLIDDLLSFSRIEMRVHVPPRGIVELNEMVEFVAQSLEPVANSAGIAIAVEGLPTPARVRGDREELVQVFQNLIQNAIRYGKPGGHVNVRMTREPAGSSGPQRLAIAVEDDGEGIPPEHLPRLTERFYRVSVSASREKGGTGLGLAIVKHIVTRHRGELKIASTLGTGSTFTVLLDELPPSATHA